MKGKNALDLLTEYDMMCVTKERYGFLGFMAMLKKMPIEEMGKVNE